MWLPQMSHTTAHTIYQYTDYGTIWQVHTVFGMHWCGQPQSLKISFHSTRLQVLVKWCLVTTSFVATSEGIVCRSKGRDEFCYYNL